MVEQSLASREWAKVREWGGVRVCVVWSASGVSVWRDLGGRRMVVRSESPRPPRRQHRKGTPTLTSEYETSGRLQQRGDAAGGGDGSTLHRGSTDGVSCANGNRQQVPFPASGLSDKLVG